MYAIIEQGAKQYKVAKGDVINIELTDVAPDARTIDLTRVLMLSDGTNITVGNPYIEGAKVVATMAEDAVVGGPKVYPSYFRRRKASKKKIGHRQKYLQVTVDEIVA